MDCSVGVAEHLEASGIARRGALVMLPQESLLREWLLELAKHCSGFHVVEQRCDGSLFSLTYGQSGAHVTTVSTMYYSPFVTFFLDGSWTRWSRS